MSYFNTKQALITQLLTVVDEADVVFENKKESSENKSLWFEAFLIPGPSAMMGKSSASSDEQRGIFQVTVYVKVNSNEYDNVQLQAIDTVLSGFTYNTTAVHLNQNVDILESEVNEGSVFESWYKREISINYLTFSERV